MNLNRIEQDSNLLHYQVWKNDYKSLKNLLNSPIGQVNKKKDHIIFKFSNNKFLYQTLEIN